MSGLLQNMEEVDFIIRQVHKLASLIKAGQIVDAWREVNKLLSYFEDIKQNIIKNAAKKVENA
jgi:hypothetical protein